MSTRLTKALRGEIIEAVYKASNLPAKQEALLAKASAAATDIVTKSIPPKIMELFAEYPDWFDTISNVWVYGVGLPSNYAQLNSPLPTPQRGAQEIAKQVREWCDKNFLQAKAALDKDTDELKNSVAGLLAGYRTVESLLKAAPEMKKFIPTSSVNYPIAIPVSNVLATMLSRGVALS